jgi:S1-C subfamily serine protease
MMASLQICTATALILAAPLSHAGTNEDLTRYALVVYGQQRFGSGVAISEHRVVTSCHTLQGARRVGVANRDMSIKRIAERGMAMPGRDVCLLHFESPHGFPVPPIGTVASAVSGGVVTAVGYSNGQLSAVTGPLLGTQGVTGSGAIINSDTPVSPGASGGGLFNGEGELVGIITYIANDRQGRRVGNYSAPIDWAIELSHLQPYAVWALYQGGEFWRSQH